jgi:hypothetical protein
LNHLGSANFDLELALIFRSLGWLNVVDVNSVISVESPAELVRDYHSIRGSDTQRILYRHHPGTLFGSLKSTLTAGLGELMSLLVSPRRGLHGLQRLAAISQLQGRREQRRLLSVLQQTVAKLNPAATSHSRSTRTAA